MKSKKFRIQNFRSIVDTGWRNLSPDNITVLIGQNESGKTSVLQALAAAFSAESISEDDLRLGAPLPQISLRLEWTEEDNKVMLNSLMGDGYSEDQVLLLLEFMNSISADIQFDVEWQKEATGKYSGVYQLSCSDIENIAEAAVKFVAENCTTSKLKNTVIQQNPSTEKPTSDKTLSKDAFYDAAWFNLPFFIYFDQKSGMLPKSIDISKTKEGQYFLHGKGETAANNFLTVSGLDLNQLVNSDVRTRENILERANEKISREFNEFWSQTIGREQKLKLSCGIHSYSEREEKSGKEYLVFWISDGLTKLYPDQRSQGVIWFVSFFLQMKASENTSFFWFFLLDEPGANLHSKAQNDVLKLINDLSKTMPIMYSTHMPGMLEDGKYYRILAVQRVGEDVDNPTEIRSASELGAASQDTLSPLLTAMGANLSQQEVIKRKNNVLIEEISGFYYLTAFWILTAEKKTAHFIATTGVSNIPTFAYMFLGWGLDFISVMDDDSSGRKVFNQMKRDLYGNDETCAREKMFKIKDCKGIEDIFTKDDFMAFVLGSTEKPLEEVNSQLAKKYSKPVLAYGFLEKIRQNEISLSSLSSDTQKRITDLVQGIASRID